MSNHPSIKTAAEYHHRREMLERCLANSDDWDADAVALEVDALKAWEDSNVTIQET